MGNRRTKLRAIIKELRPEIEKQLRAEMKPEVVEVVVEKDNSEEIERLKKDFEIEKAVLTTKWKGAIVNQAVAEKNLSNVQDTVEELHRHIAELQAELETEKKKNEEVPAGEERTKKSAKKNKT